MLNKFQKHIINKGFTLAEVLVTLAVIGIVASLTIPSLIKSYQEKQYKSAFKKNYQMLEQARLMVKANNGGTLKGLGGVNGLHNEYIKYLKYVKIVPGAWDRTDLSYYNSNPYPYASIAWSGYNGIYLTSGALVQILGYNTNCDGSRYTLDTPAGLVNDKCAGVYLDTNAEKGPNVLGKDFFLLTISDDRTWSYVSNWRYSVYGDDCNTSGNGQYCGVKYLKNE